MRPSRDTWAMQLALLTGRRSTCCRRQVGCVLLNARGHVLATGNNGVAAGQQHCNEPVVEHHVDRKVAYDKVQTLNGQGLPADWVGGSLIHVYPHACPGALAPSGTQLDACQAIHAEQNALLQCRDVYAIETCYVTASPCVTCTKLLLNTSCQRVVFVEAYPQPAAQDLWVAAGRVWEQLEAKL